MDTQGWDIIYIATTEKCNENLGKNMSGLISTFDYKSQGIEISGTFGQWQIVNGGSDKFVHFKIPIVSGKLNVNGIKTDLAGVTPIMSIKLDFVDNPQNKDLKNLTFDVDSGGSGGTPKNVFTINVDASGEDATITSSKNPVAWGVMNSSMPQVFANNRDNLSYMFSQINLVPPQADSWVAPKEIEFAYLDVNEGFFVVFTCITTKDVSKLPRVPDTSVLDNTSDFFVCISEKIVLERLIQPGLPEAFGHGATASNFVYKAVSDIPGQMEIGKIVNNGELATDTAEWGLDTYYPKIQSLVLSINNNHLNIVVDGSFDITGLAGASCSFEVVLNNTFSFDSQSQSLKFSKDPNPKTTYNKNIPWYDWLAVAPFFLGLIALILELVTNNVTSTVTDSITSSENAKLSANLNNTVKWTGYDSTTFTSGELAQALTLKSKL